MLGLIFSYNRALQLDGTLRSFLLHCQDADLLNLFVLYRTSSPLHTHQYGQLIQEYASKPYIHFIEQRNFRRDVMELLYRPTIGTRPGSLRRTLIGLGWRLGFINNLWKQTSVPDNLILFLVDDNIFVKDFLLQDAVQSLNHHHDVIGYSLRLGTNTTHCYTLDKFQSLPVFEHITLPVHGSLSPATILKFDWTAGDADFGYPLEVSSSIYRLRDIRPILNVLPFQNPNFLESRLSRQAYRFRFQKPYLLCYKNSITFCNPINSVQTIHQNIAGVKIGYSVEELARKYDMGERVNVKEYDGFVSTGCHQEVELVFASKV